MKIIINNDNRCYLCLENINYYFIDKCECHQYLHDNCYNILEKKCIICNKYNLVEKKHIDFDLSITTRIINYLKLYENNLIILELIIKNKSGILLFCYLIYTIIITYLIIIPLILINIIINLTKYIF